jgi:uncharacterized membrane protein YphA (DoxX/SURF4 family)
MNKVQHIIEKCDYHVITFFREYADEFARFAFFLIFFWFGILKIFQVSAAGPLVNSLLEVTFLNFIPATTFMIALGTFEALLGVIALIPKLERVTFVLLGLHMITTIFPLFLLPEITWAQPFVPTLTGQYIMKNLALLGMSFLLFTRVRPMSETHSIFAEEDKKV